MVDIQIPEGGIERIQNAARRIDKTIYVVGSQASGMATTMSDFDYIIPDIKCKEWKKIKNSMPGAKDRNRDLPNRIELIKNEVDRTKPYIEINP
jgi:hypothetical protein